MYLNCHLLSTQRGAALLVVRDPWTIVSTSSLCKYKCACMSVGCTIWKLWGNLLMYVVVTVITYKVILNLKLFQDLWHTFLVTYLVSSEITQDIYCHVGDHEISWSQKEKNKCSFGMQVIIMKGKWFVVNNIIKIITSRWGPERIKGKKSCDNGHNL